MAVLEFTFSTFFHFLGTWIFLVTIIFGICDIAKSFSTQINVNYIYQDKDKKKDSDE